MCPAGVVDELRILDPDLPGRLRSGSVPHGVVSPSLEASPNATTIAKATGECPTRPQRHALHN